MKELPLSKLPLSKLPPLPAVVPYDKVKILLKGYKQIYDELKGNNSQHEYIWIRQMIEKTLDSFHDQL